MCVFLCDSHCEREREREKWARFEQEEEEEDVARRWIYSGRSRCNWFSSSFPWSPLTSPSPISATLASFNSKMSVLSLSLSLSLMALLNFAWWFSVWMNPSLIFAYVNSYNWAPISGDALLIDFWIDVIVIDWSRSEYLVWFALMLSEFWYELI